MVLGRYMDSMAQKGSALRRIDKTGTLMAKDVQDLFYDFDGPLADLIKSQLPIARTVEKHYDKAVN
jgi:hypothetical protein